MDMYKRTLVAQVTEELASNPAVAILGPRQVGKTTLAHIIAKDKSVLYLDLENDKDVQKLKDPADYLKLHADKLVILDEIQFYPALFRSLRGIIDAELRSGTANGRFLILGSASNVLLKQSAESLAGRISYLELTGLNPFEIEIQDRKHICQLWLRGGFPKSYAARNDNISTKWRKNFIKTYIERDIPQLGVNIPTTILTRFWTMLAHRQGEPLNASALASSLGNKSVTVSRYLDMMVDLLLVRKLMPWYSNVNKRLKRTPRTYIRDSGILHTSLNIPDYECLLGHRILGKSWEGFVIENILAILPHGVQAFYYRTAAGAEIDLLLEWGLDDHWAIEIKAHQNFKLMKGFHIACEDLKVKRKFVVYPGEDTFSFGNGIMVMSLPHFLEKLNTQLN